MSEAEKNSSYYEGYKDGVTDSHEERSVTNAYYTGVGYGKKQSGDKSIGFHDSEHLAAFERGIKQKDNHFISQKKEMGFFEKLFDFRGRKQARYVKKKEKLFKRRSRSLKRAARKTVRKSGYRKYFNSTFLKSKPAGKNRSKKKFKRKW